VATLSTLFVRQAGTAALVWTQNPISIPPDSEPQPDIALLLPNPERYRRTLPGAKDVLLLVELADNTALAYDRTVKLPLYAGHGIREVWMVNLPGRALEIYRDPKDGAYRVKLERSAADTASPLALPALRVELGSLLAE
jgi:Uma2 family endonuclease